MATTVPLMAIAPVWLSSPKVNVPKLTEEPTTPDKVTVLPLAFKLSDSLDAVVPWIGPATAIVAPAPASA